MLFCPVCKFYGDARIHATAETEELWWECPMCKRDWDL